MTGDPIDIAAGAISERHTDLSACPYYQTVDKPDVPTEPCAFGCYDEPACTTSCPSEAGWPVEDIRRRYATLLDGVDDPGLGEPDEGDYLDAIAVLEALREAGWRVVRSERIPFERDHIYDEWTPEATS